jgi:beta-carotene 15,15'-dioxygenase
MLTKHNYYISHQLIFILIASSFVLLGAINLFQNINFQISLVAISVILFGIPHGALDFELIGKNSFLKKYIGNKIKFTITYISLSILLSMFWLQLPEFSLAAFLLISVFHWGESDAIPKRKQNDNSFRYIAEIIFYGSALLTLNTFLHSSELVELYSYLSTIEFSEKIVQVSNYLAPLNIISFLYLCFHYLKESNKLKSLELFLIFVSMIFLKPLIAFLLYFCFFHSPKHLIDFFQYNKEKSGYLQKMLLGSTISVIFLLIFYFFIDVDLFTNIDQINLGLFRTIFICLAALTIPHVALVMIWHRESRKHH